MDISEEFREKVFAYVRKECGCEPASLLLASPEDGEVPVFMVSVASWGPQWEGVKKPEFWFVCTQPTVNTYRSDMFVTDYWKEEQDLDTQVDFIRSFHIGFSVRMLRRDLPLQLQEALQQQQPQQKKPRIGRRVRRRSR